MKPWIRNTTLSVAVLAIGALGTGIGDWVLTSYAADVRSTQNEKSIAEGKELAKSTDKKVDDLVKQTTAILCVIAPDKCPVD